MVRQRPLCYTETMAPPCTTAESDFHRSGTLYGAFAFGTIVLTCFGGYFYSSRFYQPASHVPVVFALGAIYVTLDQDGSLLVANAVPEDKLLAGLSATQVGCHDDTYLAMLKIASLYFGQNSGKLVRGEETKGTVELGELKYLGEAKEPVAEQPAQEDEAASDEEVEP